MPFGLSTIKLIGIGLGALALIAALLWIKDAFDDRAELRIWQDDVVKATRAAANRPNLSIENVAQQITLLGEGLKNCKEKVGIQNNAINALGQTTATQQNASAIEQKRALQRVEAVAASADRLLKSSRSPGATAKPCEPSPALRKAWK